MPPLATIIWAAVLVVPVLLITHSIVNLIKNYNDARKVGCPIRMIPISPLNPIWMLIDQRVLSYVRRLPFGLGDNSFTRYNWRCWEVEDRYRSHHEMGDIWVLVTPYKNWLFLNDPDAIMSHYKRPLDFPRPQWSSDVLAAFGPSIAVSTGESWKTQRRLVTRCFNEQNNAVVWSESLNQATQMIQYWSSKKSVVHVARDLRTLSLHVLSRAVFGTSFLFEGDDDKKATGADQSMDYRDALGIILENCILLVLFGPKLLSRLSKIWLPQNLQILNRASETFNAYMVNLYDNTKQMHADDDPIDSNLMSILVKASQEEGAKGGLTESEIYGNIFVINFAGHDTTAHTFTFATYLLAAHPQVQDWVAEEVRAVVGNRRISDLDYRTDYPKLKRCLAVMYESLRLYTIVPTLRWTGDKSTTIEVNGKTYFLPAYTIVIPSYGSVHTEPKYWGDDSLEFNPCRWINSGNHDSEPGSEDFLAYKRGSFNGWSEGMRDCPGRKFSQTEFVATMASLFENHRVEPAKQPGESPKDACQRVNDLVKNDSGPVLLLQMLHPEKAPLVWRKV